MNAVDTNVLIYAHDPRDPTKRDIATALLDSLIDGILLWQVAGEFLWASRKLAPFGYPQTQAWGEINTYRPQWSGRMWQIDSSLKSLLAAIVSSDDAERLILTIPQVRSRVRFDGLHQKMRVSSSSGLWAEKVESNVVLGDRAIL